MAHVMPEGRRPEGFSATTVPQLPYGTSETQPTLFCCPFSQGLVVTAVLLYIYIYIRKYAINQQSSLLYIPAEETETHFIFSVASTLLILDAQEKDSGVYVCSVGVFVGKITLKIVNENDELSGE